MPQNTSLPSGKEYDTEANGLNKALYLEADLQHFTGSEYCYRNTLGLKYTDGVKYLADKAGSHWLIDLIASYQPKLRDRPFQLWSLKKSKDDSAVGALGVGPR